MDIEPTPAPPQEDKPSGAFELKALKRTSPKGKEEAPKLKLPPLNPAASSQEIQYQPTAGDGQSYDVSQDDVAVTSSRPATKTEVTEWFARMGGEAGLRILAKDNADKVEQLLAAALAQVDRQNLPKIFAAGIELRRRADPEQLPEYRELEGKITLAERAARSLEQVVKQANSLFVRPLPELLAAALKTPIERLSGSAVDQIGFAARFADECERIQLAIMIASGAGLEKAGEGGEATTERINRVLKYEPLGKATEKILERKNMSDTDKERQRLERKARIREGIEKKGPALPDEAEELRTANVRESLSRGKDVREIAKTLRSAFPMIAPPHPGREEMDALHKLYRKTTDVGKQLPDEEILRRHQQNRVKNFGRSLMQWFEDECKLFQTVTPKLPALHEIEGSLAQAQARLAALEQERKKKGAFFETARTYLTRALTAVAKAILETEERTGELFPLSAEYRQQLRFLGGTSTEDRITFTDTTNEISEAARKQQQERLQAEQARRDDPYNRWK